MKTLKIKANLDWFIVVIPLLLASAGIATLYSITSISGKSNIVWDQIIYLAIGIGIYIFFALFDYRQLKSYSWYLYLLGFVLLLMVDIIGQSVFGSRRWINLFFFQFQPSEVMKLFILILSASFFFKGKEKPSIRSLVFYLALCILPIALILREPDLGTALVISVLTASILLASKISRKIIVVIFLLLAVSSPIVWMKLKPYQKDRITSFVNPDLDPLGSGYNVNQSKITVGSGGLFGKGFSGATQSQLQFLPVAHIDFVFAGWAEATGFVGSMVLVVLFAGLIWRIFIIGQMSKDTVGYIFCIGAGSIFAFQSFVNIGMNIGLMPVTGIPLPFVSSGGTSFITMSAMLGIVQSIYLRRKSLKFD